jgi:hypothetical protein
MRRVKGLMLAAVLLAASSVAAQTTPAPTRALGAGEIEANLARWLTTPLNDAAQAGAIKGFLGQIDMNRVRREADPETTARIQALLPIVARHVETWEAVARFATDMRGYRAATAAGQTMAVPVYRPPGTPAEPPPPVAAPVVPVETGPKAREYDEVADHAAFALFRETVCLSTGLSQVEAILVLRNRALWRGPDVHTACPIVQRCEALTPESLAANLKARSDVPSLTDAVRRCDTRWEEVTFDDDLGAAYRRLDRYDRAGDVNRLRMEFIRLQIERDEAAARLEGPAAE